VGAGVSGLTAAWRLSSQHDVLLFERQARLGGHANTVEISDANTTRNVDTGFIVFNDRTYPSFTKLLSELGIEGRASEMSFSVRCDQTGLEYNGTSLVSMFCQRKNLISPAFFRMLQDIVSFNRRLKRDLAEARLDYNWTLADYVTAGRYRSLFQEKYLLPMVSAIWSMSINSAMQMPIKFFANFFSNHGLLDLYNRPQWYTVEGGSKCYVEKISNHLGSSVHRDTSIVSIERNTGKTGDHAVRLTTSTGDHVDVAHVFLATHSDEALGMLKVPTESEASILGAIRYASNTAILHQDTSLLPVRKRGWASWNYYLDRHETEFPVLTYNLNILQNEAGATPWCVTLNYPESSLKRVREVFHYSHPSFDHAAVAAQSRKAEICGQKYTSYCGAYWGNGFHEDGVRSAEQALALFEQRVVRQQVHHL